MFMSKTIYTFIVAVLMAGLFGCDAPKKAKFVIGHSPIKRVRKVRVVDTFTAGYSVENRKIEYSVLGTGDDVTFIIATIHGNESAGTPLARGIIELLKERGDILVRHKIVILPMANPDGFHHNQRYNANGVDLNRNFVAFNRINNERNGPHGLSEPESKIIERLILQYKPDRILSFHEPLACLDYDGPGGKIARAMGAHTDLPVKKLGSRPGSLGAYAGETLGIPIITVEFRPMAKLLSAEQIWAKYSKMTLAAIEYNAK
jgi:protein MpaA